MGRIIALANQKGGVGKTTTAINLSSTIAEMGKRVLLVDFDPQGNSCSGIGIDKNSLSRTVYDLLIDDEFKIDDIIIKTEFKNLFVIPSNIHLSGAQIELLEEPDRAYKLKKKISPLKDKFDYIFIDCPPSLGMLTLNALAASDSVLIPLQCEYYALEGLSQLLKVISLVKERQNPNLKLEGVILTMYDSRTILSNQVVNDVRKHFKAKTYETIIPRNIRLSEAPSFGKPINYYDKTSKGFEAYISLAREVLGNE